MLFDNITIAHGARTEHHSMLLHAKKQTGVPLIWTQCQALGWKYIPLILTEWYRWEERERERKNENALQMRPWTVNKIYHISKLVIKSNHIIINQNLLSMLFYIYLNSNWFFFFSWLSWDPPKISEEKKLLVWYASLMVTDLRNNTIFFLALLTFAQPESFRHTTNM